MLSLPNILRRTPNSAQPTNNGSPDGENRNAMFPLSPRKQRIVTAALMLANSEHFRGMGQALTFLIRTQLTPTLSQMSEAELVNNIRGLRDTLDTLIEDDGGEVPN